MNSEAQELGLRAREEVHRLSKAAGLTATEWIPSTTLSKAHYSNWLHYAPNGLSLKYLALAGADITYILTGRRDTREKEDRD